MQIYASHEVNQINRNYDRLPGLLPGSFFELPLLDAAVKIASFSLQAGERQVAGMQAG